MISTSNQLTFKSSDLSTQYKYYLQIESIILHQLSKDVTLWDRQIIPNKVGILLERSPLAYH